MKEKLRETKGITLVALIITIIVLLILAMVTIKAVQGDGIIQHAKKARDEYERTSEEENRMIQDYSDYIEEQIGMGKTEDELAMEKYVLGEDLKGQPLENICNWKGQSADWSFPNPLNGEKVHFLTTGSYCYTENNEEVFDYAIYIKYKNKAYRILAKYEYTEGENGHDGTESMTTKSVAMIYEPKGKEGQTVEYSYDGTEANKKQWTIIYDNGDNLEIVSPDSMGNLTLGYNDTEATGNNDFEKAVNSYNNAIERINKYTSSLVTNPNKLGVRSAGSNPNNPNSKNTEKYTSEKLGSWNCSYNGTPVTINGVGERSDRNYEQDLVRMSYHGIAGTGNTYWLASRFVNSSPYYVNFNVRAVYSGGNYGASGLCVANSSGRAVAYDPGYAVRPVVKIENQKN